MKHNALLLSLSIAAMALTSCADDVVTEPSTQNEKPAISFRPSMNGQSRATETTNANIASIYVTSLFGDNTYFHDLNFTKGADNFFTSATEYYWLGDTTTLQFYAYSPSMDDLGADITIDSITKKLENYVTPEDIADQRDFITAYATGTRKQNEVSGVPLTFDHRLAQIQLNAKSANPNYIYKVAGMRIGRPQTTGSFDFSTDTWTLDDWHETAVYESSTDEITLSATPVSIMGKSGNAMLIPQTLTPWSPKNDPDNVAREAYLSVLINISTKDGVQVYPFPSDTRQYAWASIPLSGTWEQGKKYIYTLDFTDGAGNVDPDDPQPGTPVLGDPIKATVTVTDWTEADKSIPMTPVK